MPTPRSPPRSERFDTFAAATYVNGPSSSYLTATDPADILNTAAAGQTLAVSSQQVMTDLQRARTEQVNKESAARLAKQKADQAAVDAQTSQDTAVSALTQAQQTFGDQQGELDQLTRRTRRRARPNSTRPAAWSAPASRQPAGQPAAAPTPAEPSTANWDRARGARSAGARQWDSAVGPHAAAIPERLRQRRPDRDHQRDPGYRVHLGAGHRRHGPQLPAEARPPAHPDRLHQRRDSPRLRQAGLRVRDQAAACRRCGVPYSWGGGNAAGPSRGIDSGAGTVGFDCSGLILYAFAGVGIKLPHYSGSQYNMGRKIPSSQMRRGDVIFYGPDGSQHVTLYLGNGQMLEAPYTGSGGQGLARAHQRHDAVRGRYIE